MATYPHFNSYISGGYSGHCMAVSYIAIPCHAVAGISARYIAIKVGIRIATIVLSLRIIIVMRKRNHVNYKGI